MPLAFGGVNLVDMLALTLSIVLVWLASYTFKRNEIDSYDGIVMLLVFAAYYVWLFMNH